MGLSVKVDHYLEMGDKQYANAIPCQDYAFSGALMGRDGKPGPDALQWAAVADGCGGSWSETDLGSRAVVWAFRHALQARVVNPLRPAAPNPSDPARGRAGRSGSTVRPVGEGLIDTAFEGELKEALSHRRISPSLADYLSTLVGLVSSDTDAQVLIWGDGAVGHRYTDGRQRLATYEFEGNAPFYLAYTLDDQFLRKYLKRLAAPVTETTYECSIDKYGRILLANRVERKLDFDTFRHGHLLTYKPEEDGISSIAIFTDGIMSLHGVEPWQVAGQLMDIKTTRGGFVKQRAREVLSSYRQAGNPARDDVAVAVCSYCI